MRTRKTIIKSISGHIYYLCYKCISQILQICIYLSYRCLQNSTGCLQFTPTKCTNIIMAAFLLHNFCIDLKLPNPDLIDDDHDPDFEFDRTTSTEDNQIRLNLIQNVFS